MNMIKKDKAMTQYKQGELLYLISPQISLLKTSSRKFRAIYIRPLVVYKIIDKFQDILLGIECKILIGIYHFNRLKHAFLITTIQLIH